MYSGFNKSIQVEDSDQEFPHALDLRPPNWYNCRKLKGKQGLEDVGDEHLSLLRLRFPVTFITFGSPFFFGEWRRKDIAGD